MNAETIAVIGTAVVTITQLLKWAGVPDKLGPILVLVLAAFGVALWTYSNSPAEQFRTSAFSLAVAWITVSATAAGVFGFTRASSDAITKTSTPSSTGAGSSPTKKIGD